MTTSGKRLTPVVSHLIFTFPVKESCEVAPSPAHAVPNCKSPVLQVKWKQDTFSRRCLIFYNYSQSAQLHGEEDQVVPPLWAAHSAGILSNLACEVNLVRWGLLGVWGQPHYRVSQKKWLIECCWSHNAKCSITCAWKDVFGRFTKTKQDQVLPRRVYWKFGPAALN